MFKPVIVQLNNGNDFSVNNHPFTLGVPWPQGVVSSPRDISLVFRGQRRVFHGRPLARWADGSIKWMLLDFQASLKAGEQTSIQLVCDKDADAKYERYDAEPASIEISDNDAGYLIDTGIAQFVIGKTGTALFSRVTCLGKHILADNPGQILLVDSEGKQADAVTSTITFPEPDNPLRKTAVIDGCFQNSSKQTLAEYRLRLSFYAGSSTVKCEFTLSNPRAAEHPGGIWDLGDKGSLFFKELTIRVNVDNCDAGTSAIRIAPDAAWSDAANANVLLEQYSSGGENWNSNNHMNFKGEVPLGIKGFRYFEGGTQVMDGERATPCLHLDAGGKGLTAYVVDFWQNFPKAVQLDQTGLSLSLFPASHTDGFDFRVASVNDIRFIWISVMTNYHSTPISI